MEDGCREEAGVEGCIYVCLLHDVFLCYCATEAKKELANFFTCADTWVHAGWVPEERNAANRFEGVASRSAYRIKRRLNERLEAKATAGVRRVSCTSEVGAG